VTAAAEVDAGGFVCESAPMSLAPERCITVSRLVLAGVAIALPSLAFGDEPATAPSTQAPEPGEGAVRPAAADDRTGHVYIRAGADLEIPSGFLRSQVAADDVIGLGLGIDASIGVGLSRHAEIDVSGTYALMQSGGRCPLCSGDHAAANLGFTYHLAEGVALDPWARLGAGYRTADYENAAGGPAALVSGRYHGIDFADLSLGATFFPTPSFGLGPFLAADVGTYVSRPAASNGATGGPRAYAFFQLGFQLELDPARWIKKSAPAAKTASSLRTPSY
jgi:hypothetical protein